jgi:hypothetical protein
MSKAIELLGFLAKAAIAGLALAFVLVYLWPSLSERLARQEDPAPPPGQPRLSNQRNPMPFTG